jgi:hypothetical protein
MRRKIKIDKADELFSVYIRLRDKRCVRCGKLGEPDKKGRLIVGLQNSHFFNRWREGTRFDEENCDTLCMGCHEYWGEKDYEAYRDFKINRLGKSRFNLMKWRAYGYYKKDRKMEVIRIKEMIKDLEAKNDSK